MVAYRGRWPPVTVNKFCVIRTSFWSSYCFRNSETEIGGTCTAAIISYEQLYLRFFSIFRIRSLVAFAVYLPFGCLFPRTESKPPLWKAKKVGVRVLFFPFQRIAQSDVFLRGRLRRSSPNNESFLGVISFFFFFFSAVVPSNTSNNNFPLRQDSEEQVE